MRRLLAIAALGAVVVTAAVAATPPTTTTAETLTVGVNLPSEGFQVGVVRGSDVLLAQGLEIDMARILAFRRGLEEDGLRAEPLRPALLSRREAMDSRSPRSRSRRAAA